MLRRGTSSVVPVAVATSALVRRLSCIYYGWVVAAVLVGAQMAGHIGSVHLITLSIGG
jgi:hypothetical protein